MKIARHVNLFSDLVSICDRYLPLEDLDFITSLNVDSPIIILKQNSDIQFKPVNHISSGYSSYEKLFELSKLDKLDFIFILDVLYAAENIPAIINRAGALIESKGIFVLTYERINNKKRMGSNRTVPGAFPIKDGVIQKLLTSNQFYIQHELEYQLESGEDNHMVLIVAQKK